MFDFERYLADVPAVHSWDSEKTFNTGGFGPKELRKLYELAKECGVIVETGIGNSTIAFLAACPEQLITIAPPELVWDRVIDYCKKNLLATSSLKAVKGFSEIELPPIAQSFIDDGKYADLFLIDGGHAWPTVFTDICYANMMLRKGGVLLIDDVQLFQVNIATRFLNTSPDYQKIGELTRKTLMFRKLTEGRRFQHWSGYTNKMEEEHRLLPDPFDICS